MDNLQRVPLDIERVPLETEQVPDPRQKGADPFAAAVMAVKGLPASDYPRLVRQFQLTGNMKIIEDAELVYKTSNDAKAAQKLGEYLQKKAAELGYDPTVSLLAQGDVKERVAKAVEDLATANKIALEETIVQGVASGDMPFDATPEERIDAQAIAADPIIGMANLRANDQLTYEAILETAKENGITGSFLESLGGTLSSGVLAPDIIAFRDVAREFDLPLGEFETWSTATVIEAIQKKRASITSPEAQRAFDLRFIPYVINSPYVAFDAQALKIISSVYSEDGRAALSDPNRSMFYENMVWQLFDAATILIPGGAGKAGKAGMRISPELRKMAEINPAKFQAALREAILNPKSKELKAALGGAEEIALSQMVRPKFVTKEGLEAVEKMDPNLGLIPDVLEQDLKVEYNRILGISDDLERSANAAYLNALTPEAQEAAIIKQRDLFDAALKGSPRQSLARVVLNQDGSTTFETVLGANSRKGLGGPAAVKLAISYQSKGYNTRLFTISKGKRVYINESNMELYAAGYSDKLKKPTYYVEVSQRYTFDPEDMAAFGEEVVNNWAWLGRAADVVGVPSAWLKRDIYKRYVSNELLGASMTAKLEQILTPVRSLPRPVQQKLNEVIEWAEMFVETNGKAAKLEDLVGKFGNQLTPDLIKGFWTMRNYFDVAYLLANKRVYNFLGGKDGRSLVNIKTGNMYHGQYLNPTNKEHASFFAQAKAGVFNPETQTIIKLSDKQLDDLYKKGGQILRAPIAEEVGTKVTNYLLWDADIAPHWKAQPLSRYVLEYIPDYRPLIYEGKTFIRKVYAVAEHNGRFATYRKAMYAVGSPAEARRVVETLPPGEGYTWEIGDNAALSHMDRNLADMEAMRHQDARLMYGPRGKRLRGADSASASVLDPINAAMVQAHRLSGQIAMEDLASFMLAGWKKEFASVIDEMKIRPGGVRGEIELQNYREVTNALKDRVENGGRKELEAYMAWQYIHSMRGITTPSSTAVRYAMTKIGEGYYNLATKTGVLKPTADRVRDNITNWSPFEFAKTVSYVDYIKGNPARQLIVQGMQPMFIAPLAAKVYKGNMPRWVSDASNIILGARRIGLEQGLGKTVSEKSLKKAAKQMGETYEDYLYVINKFENMGILQRINARNWADDFVNTEAVLPKTKLGNAAQMAAKPFTGAVDLLGVGFNVGERINVSHSLALAWREYKQLKGIKSSRQITEEGWLDIAANAVDYSGGMVRANRAAWQKNVVLGTALQYMQFVHKSSLTLFGLNTNAFGLKASAAIAAHQLVGFGFKGIPLMGAIPDMLEDMGIVNDPELADTLRWGMYDLLFDEFFQLATSNPEADYAVTKFLAPGAGTVETGKEMFNQIFEGPIGPWLGGAPWESISGIWKGMKLAWDISTMDAGTEWDDDAWWQAGLALTDGTFAGMSQVRQGILAMKYMRYATRDGKLANVAVTQQDAIIRMITGGMRTQEEFDYWEAVEELSTIENAELMKGNFTGVDADAKEYWERIQNVLIAVGQGQKQIDEARLIILKVRKLYENDNPLYNQRFRERLWALSRDSEQNSKDLGTLIDQAMGKGVPIPQRIINNILSSTTLTDEAKNALVKRIGIWQEELKTSAEIIRNTMDLEDKYFGVEK